MIRVPLAIFLVVVLLTALIIPTRADPPANDAAISLNFQNTDIDVVLKFISDVTGRVFVKSDSVRGFVTVMAPGKLTASQALDILQSVLEIKGYTLVPGPGSMLKVLSQAEAIQGELDIGVGSGANGVSSGERMMTQVIPLRFLSAQDLKTEVSPLVSKSGSLVVDERTNSLVMTDMASNIRRLMKLIDALDVRTPQVLIESLIMEVSLTDETKLGVEWSHQSSFDSHGHRFDGQADQSFDMSSVITEGLKYAVVRDDGKLSAAIQLLATDKNVNILSTPHILTLNNQPAVIRVGEEVPVLTQTRNIQGGETIRSFDYKNVAVELEVTPRINQDREVFLKVHPVIKKILGFNAELNAPILASREAQTSILIGDGQTVVIGGLMKDDRSLSDSKVPLLGDIPLLGYFFKQHSLTKEKTELLVFITPHVILSSDEARKTTIQKESQVTTTATPDLLDARAHYELGLSYYRRKEFDQAITEWQRVLDVSPNAKLKRAAEKRIRAAEKRRAKR